MRKFGHLAVAVALCCVATDVDAQILSKTHQPFVDVSLGPDWDDAYSDSTRVPGATWRSGIGFGVDFGRSGLELDVSVPQWHVRNFPVWRYRYAGPSFGWEQQGHFYESLQRADRRSVDLAVLYRSNIPVDRHVSFNWLVGGAWVYRPEHFTTVTNELLPGGELVEVNTRQGTSFRNYMAAVARLDAEFRVGAHIALVPRVRVTIFPSLLDDSGLAPRIFTARPEVAVRWRF
jgi:hypothetical protein